MTKNKIQDALNDEDYIIQIYINDLKRDNIHYWLKRTINYILSNKDTPAGNFNPPTIKLKDIDSYIRQYDSASAYHIPYYYALFRELNLDEWPKEIKNIFERMFPVGNENKMYDNIKKLTMREPFKEYDR